MLDVDKQRRAVGRLGDPRDLALLRSDEEAAQARLRGVARPATSRRRSCELSTALWQALRAWGTCGAVRKQLVVVLCLLASCGEPEGDTREATVAGVLAQADEPLIRSRPALVAGRYARMASSPVAFMRGSLQLYRHDARSGTSLVSVSRFALDLPLVRSLGDPHLENFGALRASDGTLAIEPNDFDAADRAPYLWDVRRLASSMALAAMLANGDDAVARERSSSKARAVARATAAGYRAAVERAASGGAAERLTEQAPVARSNPILDDAFRRSRRDEAARRELGERTELAGGVRRLKRGSVDPEDPQNVYLELPRSAYAALPRAIQRWRTTLIAPPPAADLELLDAVREMGSGVASWPRVRVIMLVRGPSQDPADDMMLELKELADSGIAGLYPPGVHHDDVGRRILETSRAAWARPDAEPLWGVTDWLGLRCQIRAESEGQKSVRVERMTGARGAAEAIEELAGALGGIVARVHTSGPDGHVAARAVYARIAVDPEGFLDEQADAALAYAVQTIADHRSFVRALHHRGPALGIPVDNADGPRADLAAVLGVPPPPLPLPPLQAAP